MLAAGARLSCLPESHMTYVDQRQSPLSSPQLPGRIYEPHCFFPTKCSNTDREPQKHGGEDGAGGGGQRGVVDVARGVPADCGRARARGVKELPEPRLGPARSPPPHARAHTRTHPHRSRPRARARSRARIRSYARAGERAQARECALAARAALSACVRALVRARARGARGRAGERRMRAWARACAWAGVRVRMRLRACVRTHARMPLHTRSWRQEVRRRHAKKTDRRRRLPFLFDLVESGSPAGGLQFVSRGGIFMNSAALMGRIF